MIRFTLIMLMCLTYMINAYISHPLITVLFTIVSVATFLTVVFSMEIKGRLFTLFLFTTGMIIHFINGNRGLELFEGITQNLPLLAILILAPLLSIPLRREGIIDTIVSGLSNNKNDERKTFYSMSSFMMLLAPILNMGAIRIVHDFVKDVEIKPKMLSRSYYLGFTPAVLWSPFFASVGIVIYLLDVKYMSYILVGVTFSLMQAVVGLFLLRPKATTHTLLQEPGQLKPDENGLKNIFYLIVFVLGLILLLISMESLLHKPMLLLVSFICVLVPFVWVVLRNKWSVVREEYLHYKDRLLIGSRMEISLFLSAGIFGNAIANTPFINVLKSAIEWSVNESLAVLFLFILLFVTGVAMIGVHQIISIPLILLTLIESGIPFNPLPIAFMCIFSWMLSAAISPLNAMNIIISQNVKKDGFTVAFKWNGLYFLVITLMAFGYIYIIDMF